MKDTHHKIDYPAPLKAARLIAFYLAALLWLSGCTTEPGSALPQDSSTLETIGSDTTPYEDGLSAQSRVFGRVVELLNPSGIAGVEVCAHDDEELGCRITDAEGSYEFTKISTGSQLLLTITLEGHVGGAAPILVAGPEHEVAPLGMASTTILGLQQSALGVDEVEDSGQIAFGASNGISGDKINIEGFVATLSPNAGDGPYYLSSLGLPDTALNQSSSNGGGLWLNLKPGDFELTYAGDAINKNCKTLLGWGGPEILTLPILANRVTYARIECAEARE